MPAVYAQLCKNIETLERFYGDMQDIEFTIQEGKLFMLQTRSGKRVGRASVKIATDMVDEGLTTIDNAIMLVKPEHLNQLLLPQFVSTDTKQYKDNVVAVGLPASPGAAVGMIVFWPETAEIYSKANKKCVLMRDDTSPEDVGGMWAAEGVLTARGGMTSHAAVVARGWGKPCVCGCAALSFDEAAHTVTITKLDGGSVTLREGDFISLNGNTGQVLVGKQDLEPPTINSSTTTKRFMDWVDSKKSMKVLANADAPADALEARYNGAQGVGLTRTEHMFFSESRIRIVRRMILASNVEYRQKALDELLPLQRTDFEGILAAMNGLPVTVRLLDPPLHEFLPHPSQIDDAFVADVGMSSKEECWKAMEKLREVNPMLGLRGVRLGIIMPELVDMQVRALIGAALTLKYEKHKDPRPELMIPLISTASEFKHQATLIRSVVQQIFDTTGQSIDFKLGTMIEVPRAALTAVEIAKAGAEFFSYGTNDLTQLSYGFSRDDIGSYLPTYLKQGILEVDPFRSIDEYGVGRLIQLSADDGRRISRKMKTPFKAGVCGEHGGDPRSVKFFAQVGLEYVSCSPFRVPGARLAAAQAVIEPTTDTLDPEKDYQTCDLVWWSRRKHLYSNQEFF